MILKKVLLVPVLYEAKFEKGMITDKGLIIASTNAGEFTSEDVKIAFRRLIETYEY